MDIDEVQANREELTRAFRPAAFPRSAKYDVDWTIRHMMGPNVLWLTESLSQVMDLKPGMRVLDLGCGMAISSIFLAKEFDLQVWATDLWVPASDNWERIREAGLKDRVFPRCRGSGAGRSRTSRCCAWTRAGTWDSHAWSREESRNPESIACRRSRKGSRASTAKAGRGASDPKLRRQSARQRSTACASSSIPMPDPRGSGMRPSLTLRRVSGVTRRSKL